MSKMQESEEPVLAPQEYERAEEPETCKSNIECIPVMNEVFSQYHPSFQSNRFKQCPRFSIFHSKNRETENHLKENIISLNYGVMNYLGH
jgi:hypothetical protein